MKDLEKMMIVSFFCLYVIKQVDFYVDPIEFMSTIFTAQSRANNVFYKSRRLSSMINQCQKCDRRNSDSGSKNI